MELIRDRQDREAGFQAKLHGAVYQDRHGVAPGRRQAHIAKMKARRGGHV